MDGFDVVLVLGVAQGVFLALVLATSRRNAVANRYLAAVMTLFALDLFTVVYHNTTLEARWPHGIGLTYPLTFLYGPAFYFYARALTRGRRLPRWQVLAHATPFLATTALLLPFFLAPTADKLTLVHDPAASPWTPVLTLLNTFKFVHGLAYLVLILVAIRQHGQRIRDAYSQVEHRTLAWLRNLLLGSIGMWVLSLVFYLAAPVLDPAGPSDPIEGHDDWIAPVMALFIYAIGFFGLRQQEAVVPDDVVAAPTPHPFTPERTPRPAASPTAPGDAVPPEADLDATQNATPNSADGPRPRYARSGMDADAAQAAHARLLALMADDKPYLDPDLTLAALADRLGLSAHNLSEVLNTQEGTSFYAFVNRHRVEAAARRLADPAQAAYTVLAIGLESGFNSKSAFNAVFKKATGHTPSAYRQQVGMGERGDG